MAGYHLVCKKPTNGSKCFTTLEADSKDELLQVALRHASSEHGMRETMALKQELKATMKKGRPAA